MRSILLTGATGFVGGALLRRIAKDEIAITVAARREFDGFPSRARVSRISDIGRDTDWGAALRGQDVVVHCAARVHVMKDRSADPLAAFRAVNVVGTLNLARQAAIAGVRRFIFLSSIKVNGEITTLGHPFTADDLPMPQDPYGISKHEAEQGLRDIAAETGLEVVIIRPPLVYGPGVQANFAALLRAVAHGIPLPLGAINNRRSLVALDNLVDLIVTSIAHPAAANHTFLVSDGEDLSTTQLLQRMGQALGRSARLIPVPSKLIELGATLVGKPTLAHRLCGSLQVDIAKTRQILGWQPPLSVDDGLKKAAEGYRREASV
ncbi:UDP-glucose 4-epimerase family protein [Cupriavidus sp. CuC1]|uniref:UDP-glucose 4-epimerase family protein n=1 Tax=Cupriavidus sp. CuC1 TaxID=3373131 RepID=UPI0037D9340E